MSRLPEFATDTSVDRSGFTLLHMAEWGLKHGYLATDTLLALKQELQAVTKYPVLIAVDGINHFYEHSAYPWRGRT